MLETGKRKKVQFYFALLAIQFTGPGYAHKKDIQRRKGTQMNKLDVVKEKIWVL
jgi:hypothetical protein